MRKLQVSRAFPFMQKQVYKATQSLNNKTPTPSTGEKRRDALDKDQVVPVVLD
jgi:hypothetical protein